MFTDYSVAMVTPFTENGDLDWKGVEAVVQHLLKSEVPGILLSGSTGEQHSMTIEERGKLYTFVKEMVDSQSRVYAGVAAVTTRDAIRLAELASLAKVDGIMLGLSPYIRPAQAELTRYVRDVARTVAVPILLYNNPPRTGSDISAEEIAQLWSDGVIAALKEAGGIAKAKKVLTLTQGNLPLYTGSDKEVIESFEDGFFGITSIIGNLFPGEMGSVVRLLKQNEPRKARVMMDSLKSALSAVFSAPTPVGLKYALNRIGVQAGFCRAPLGLISKEQREAIESAVRINE